MKRLAMTAVRSRFAVIPMIAAIAAFAGSATAAVLRVPSEYATVQAAIDASVDRDVIRIEAGTYSGPGNQELRLAGRSLTIEGALGSAVEFAPEPLNRVFSFGSNEAPVLRNLVFRDAFSDVGGGSAVFIHNATPRFESCEFRNCTVIGPGGAVRALDGTATFIDCSFSSNNGDLGGAIALENSTATLQDCTFDANIAWDAGGAIHTSGTGSLLDLMRCEFSANRANLGGAVLVDGVGTTFTATASRFLANQAFQLGGSVFSSGGATSLASNCVFVFNTAASDGRVWFDDDSLALSVINSTMYANTGAGADKNATIVTRSAAAEIANTIVWGNGGTSINPNGATSLVVGYSCIEGGWTGLNNIDVDPRIDPATVLDPQLLSDSPCIDAGDNAKFDFVEVDRAGNPRITDGDGDLTIIIDLGAHESPAVCGADINGDGSVEFNDIVLLLGGWGPCGEICEADINQDGTVDFEDLLGLLLRWGPCE